MGYIKLTQVSSRELLPSPLGKGLAGGEGAPYLSVANKHPQLISLQSLAIMIAMKSIAGGACNGQYHNSPTG